MGQEGDLVIMCRIEIPEDKETRFNLVKLEYNS